METLQQHKAFMIYMTTPELGLSFEYIMAASNKYLHDSISLSYYIGKDERVAQSLRLRGVEDFPKLVLVFYTTQSYMSYEYFNIEPMTDTSGSGYKDYGSILRSLNDVEIICHSDRHRLPQVYVPSQPLDVRTRAFVASGHPERHVCRGPGALAACGRR